MSVADVVKSVLHELESVMQTRTIVGEAIQADDYTVIPVSKVSFGFGAGGGGAGDEKKKGGAGEGIGGGWSIEPIAFFVVGKDGAKLFSIAREESVAGKLVDLAPKVVETVKNLFERKGDEETEEADET